MKTVFSDRPNSPDVPDLLEEPPRLPLEPHRPPVDLSAPRPFRSLPASPPADESTARAPFFENRIARADRLKPADEPPFGFPPEAAMERAILGWTLVEIEERLGYRRCLAAVWELIRAEFADESLTLGQAARRCGISRGRLNVRLGEAMGLSFHELLTRYRLLRAVELMLRRDDTLEETAQSTGFNHVSNLSRHFKRVVGRSPGAFRSARRRPR